MDSVGESVLTQTYDPYGNPYASSGAGETHLGFTGEFVDPSGLVYLRARYYQPGMGRFFQRDAWRGTPNQPQTLNPYMYGLGNPILYTDPSGHCVLGQDCSDWIEDMGDYLFDVVAPFVVGYAIESLDNAIPFVPLVSMGAEIAHLIDPCSPRLDDIQDPYFQMGRQAARNTALAASTVIYLGGIGLMAIGIADITAGGAITIGSGGALVVVNVATVTTGLALIEVGAILSVTSGLQIASITIRDRHYPILHHYSAGGGGGGGGGGSVRRTAAGRPLSEHAAEESLRRHGFRPPYDDIDGIIDNPTWTTEQMDGADIYIQRTSPRRYAYVIVNENGVIVTAERDLPLSDIRVRGRNNNWDWVP